MSGENIDLWLKRFRASDAQEQPVDDDSASYRALLGQSAEQPPARAKPEPQKKRASRPEGSAARPPLP